MYLSSLREYTNWLFTVFQPSTLTRIKYLWLCVYNMQVVQWFWVAYCGTSQESLSSILYTWAFKRACMQQINTNEEWNTHGISQKKKLFYPTSYKKEKPAMSHEKR